jgi:hypothetical protein
MYPWLWFWAPQVHLPWSGDVAQRIDPTTHWFFQGIRPGAGNARIEERAFDVASYGRQLGHITELLLDLAQHADGALSPKAAEARGKLDEISRRIEAVKELEYRLDADLLEQRLREAQRRGGADFDRLAARLLPLLERPPSA